MFIQVFFSIFVCTRANVDCINHLKYRMNHCSRLSQLSHVTIRERQQNRNDTKVKFIDEMTTFFSTSNFSVSFRFLLKKQIYRKFLQVFTS